MVRTKGDGAVTKVVGAKAPRKQLVSNTGASSSAYSSPSDPNKKGKPSSGLPYCPQPTPDWQKSVKSFFTFSSSREDKENEAQAVGGGDDVPKVVSGDDAPKVGSEDDVQTSKGKRTKKGKGKSSQKSGKGKGKKSKSDPEDNTEETKPAEEPMDNASLNKDDASDHGKNSDNDNATSDKEEDKEKEIEEDVPAKRKRNNIIDSDEDE